MALDQERGSAVANTLHRGWEGSWPRGLKGQLGTRSRKGKISSSWAGQEPNTWTGVFGPVPLLSHETGHREPLTGCKQLSSHTCYWIYGSALDTPIPGHDSFYEKPGSSIKHAESLAVGFSTALSPGASCTVAAAKAGLPKQACRSAPLELAPDLPLGVLAISPRGSERKFSLWFHCLENSPNSFLSSCLGRDWQHQMAAFCIISEVK